MPIDTQHAGYELATKKATRVRDFAAGEDTVKAKGIEYLPKLGGQSDEEYRNYKTRGYIVPAVEPTMAAMSGSITRKPATIETSLDHIDKNIDGDKKGVDLFVSDMIKELLYGGAAGLQLSVAKKLVGSKESKPVHVLVQFSKFIGLPLNVPPMRSSRYVPPHFTLITLLLLIVELTISKNPPGFTSITPLTFNTLPG